MKDNLKCDLVFIAL